MTPRVPFVDLTLHEDGADVREAIARVLACGWFVLGPEVEAFEDEFAAACRAAHAVTVGNGTPVSYCTTFGREIAAELRQAAVSGVIVPST